MELFANKISKMFPKYKKLQNTGYSGFAKQKSHAVKWNNKNIEELRSLAMIKPRPDLEEESMKLYKLWKESGLNIDGIDLIIKKYASVEYKAWDEAIRTEKEYEV